MLSLSEFREDLLQSVKVTAESEKEGTSAAFVQLCAQSLVEIEVLPDYEPCFYVGTGRRNKNLRVDAYSYDSFEGAMYLIIAHYIGDSEAETITKTESNQVFEKARAFAEETINTQLPDTMEMSTPAYDLAMLIKENLDYIKKFKIILVTDSVMSERISELKQGVINGKSVEYFLWDVSRFYKAYLSDSVRDELEIDFTEYSDDGIICLEASDAETETCRSYLCVIPGKVLADIYDNYGSRLLEGNVRSFLSVRGAVNKAIRNTALNNPQMFFVYNNGISATATDVIVRDIRGKKVMVYAKDLQIVNGGQTTASLSSARFKDKASLEGIFVQMKLTVVRPEDSHNIIPMISRSSNSQNKVNEADFFSNHPYHVRLEEMSRRIFAPAIGGAQYETHWFYERARGQYTQAEMRLTRAEKRKFEMQNPKSQLIRKTDLAKVINSWRRLPFNVSQGAQTNFIKFANYIVKEWDKQDTSFNEKYFKECVALTILFNRTEQIVSAQPWYEKGYRANIVTYSIAMLSEIIHLKFAGYQLDLLRIWSQQSLPEILETQLALISKSVFESITDPNRETVNVTQWCKREACWKQVLKSIVNPVDGLETALVSNEEQNEINREARKVQAIDKTITSQIEVYNLGEEYWRRLLEWGLRRKLFSPSEITILNKATKMSRGIFPNDIQCDRLLEMRSKSVQEGFSETS